MKNFSADLDKDKVSCRSTRYSKCDIFMTIPHSSCKILLPVKSRKNFALPIKWIYRYNKIVEGNYKSTWYFTFNAMHRKLFSLKGAVYYEFGISY